MNTSEKYCMWFDDENEWLKFRDLPPQKGVLKHKLSEFLKDNHISIAINTETGQAISEPCVVETQPYFVIPKGMIFLFPFPDSALFPIPLTLLKELEILILQDIPLPSPHGHNEYAHGEILEKFINLPIKLFNGSNAYTDEEKQKVMDFFKYYQVEKVQYSNSKGTEYSIDNFEEFITAFNFEFYHLQKTAIEWLKPKAKLNFPPANAGDIFKLRTQRIARAPFTFWLSKDDTRRIFENKKIKGIDTRNIHYCTNDFLSLMYEELLFLAMNRYFAFRCKRCERYFFTKMPRKKKLCSSICRKNWRKNTPEWKLIIDKMQNTIRNTKKYKKSIKKRKEFINDTFKCLKKEYKKTPDIKEIKEWEEKIKGRLLAPCK